MAKLPGFRGTKRPTAAPASFPKALPPVRLWPLGVQGHLGMGHQRWGRGWGEAELPFFGKDCSASWAAPPAPTAAPAPTGGPDPGLLTAEPMPSTCLPTLGPPSLRMTPRAAVEPAGAPPWHFLGECGPQPPASSRGAPSLFAEALLRGVCVAVCPSCVCQRLALARGGRPRSVGSPAVQSSPLPCRVCLPLLRSQINRPVLLLSPAERWILPRIYK